MNGLTTNALDLVSLRVPGASIKEALLPTEQITLSGYLDSGWSYEAYYQFSEEHIVIDEAGTYFGSEVASKNGNRLIFSGSFGDHTGDARNRACGYLNYAGGGACNAATIANGMLVQTSQWTYLYQEGLKSFMAGDNYVGMMAKTAVMAGGAAAHPVAGFGGTAGDIKTLASLGNAGYTGLLHGYTNYDEYTKKEWTKIGVIDLASNGHLYADGDDQYGFALRKYLDDVGTGVELGFYFAQFDSKVPYIRYKGQQGVYGGDLFGAFQLAKVHLKLVFSIVH